MIAATAAVQATSGRRFLAVLALAAAVAVPHTGGAQDASRQIMLGVARTIRSEILNEDRELQITLPESYSRTTISYPVLYLLDGSSNLLHATATTRFLAAARNRIPEMIVVAIPNTNRNRDLTPGPGAVTFERFLGQELIPWVERTYRAAPERILWGHSLSGSFTVHALLNQPSLFDAYIAASAPVWRYDSLARDIRAGFAPAAKAGTTVDLSVGERESPQMRGGITTLVDALKAAAPGTAPNWSFDDLVGEDHSSTKQRSLYYALERRYAEWRPPYFETRAELDSIGGLKALEAHYERFSKRLGYTNPLPMDLVLQVGQIYLASERHADVVTLANAYAASYPGAAENLVNQVGYDLLRRGQLERAVEVFKKNAAAFPASPNVHDSLGDAYCRAGNAALGQQSYQAAVRAAEARTPQPARLSWYRDKAAKGCAPSDTSRLRL